MKQLIIEEFFCYNQVILNDEIKNQLCEIEVRQGEGKKERNSKFHLELNNKS